MANRTAALQWHCLTLGMVVFSGACAADSESTTSRVPSSASSAADECGVRSDGSRRLKILHLNDVYRIGGLLDGSGGLARVRSLRTRLERNCSAVLVTHAGDFLYPSLESRALKGAHMIEVLNGLDGQPDTFDERMFVTLGNHEFDASRLADVKDLGLRVGESQFSWLAGNIEWAQGENGRPLLAHDNLKPADIVDMGGLRVGVFGTTIANKVPEFVEAIDDDYVGVARKQVADLRAGGAELVLAITHLDAAQDLEILAALEPPLGPDLILGGHEHQLMTLPQAASQQAPAVFKGDADARTVRVIDVSVDDEGAVRWASDGVGEVLDDDHEARDPELAETIERIETNFARDYCAGRKQPPTCLETPLTETSVELIAEETTIRRCETNYGNWIADRMLAAFADHQPDLALVNAGSLRLNQNIAAGTRITARIVAETFAYPSRMYLLSVRGSDIRAALDRSISGWTGQGHWLQMAGLSWTHDVAAGRARDIHILREGQRVALEDQATYRLVTIDYLIGLSPGDADGYTMLDASQVIEVSANGRALEAEVIAALKSAGAQGIAPQLEGRIRTVGDSGVCASH